MYVFQDKKGRDVCLVPEITAIVQQLYRDAWSKSLPKPVRVFYVAKCYRYERPQKGRYREFTQFGIECMGGKPPEDQEEVTELLRQCLGSQVEFQWDDSVQRGLDYYVEDGFEASCGELGAQQQVAGGGRYAEGIGWAIGIDRLLLARRIQSDTLRDDRPD